MRRAVLCCRLDGWTHRVNSVAECLLLLLVLSSMSVIRHWTVLDPNTASASTCKLRAVCKVLTVCFAPCCTLFFSLLLPLRQPPNRPCAMSPAPTLSSLEHCLQPLVRVLHLSRIISSTPVSVARLRRRRPPLLHPAARSLRVCTCAKNTTQQLMLDTCVLPPFLPQQAPRLGAAPVTSALCASLPQRRTSG